MSNRFRPQYRSLSLDEIAAMTDLKEEAEHLARTIEKLPLSRERATALTKLEEAVMWAVKGLTT